MLASLALTLVTPFQGSPVPIAPAGLSPLSGFGYSLNLSGETVIAGAPFDSSAASNAGSVRFFERDSLSGEWSLASSFTGGFFERMGFSVAIDGDVAVVGHAATATQPVRVFERVGGAWAQTATLEYSGSPVNPGTEAFGEHVDVSGGTIAVGARQARDGGGGVTGAVYLFEKVQGQWTEIQRLLPPPNPTSGVIPLFGAFGKRVSLAGDRLAVGASEARVNGVVGAGRVHVYRRGGSVYGLEQSIPSPLLPGSFRFGGYGFGFTGDTLAVGSIGTDVGVVMSAGMVHVYERSGGVWTEAAQLIDPTPRTRDYLGDSLALDGDRLVAGKNSYFSRTVGLERLGLVSFTRPGPGGTWRPDEEIFDPLEAGDTGFGASMALEGNRMLAAADSAVIEGEFLGALYAYELDSGTAPLVTVACSGGPCSCAPYEPWLGCGNSTKKFAELSAFGSASISSDDLTFSVREAVPGVVARLLLGPGMIAPQPMGDGSICIASARQLAPRMTGPDGSLVIPGGVVSRAAQQLGAAGMILPGETWIFQVMYGEPRQLFSCRTHVPYSYALGGSVQNGRPYFVQRGFNLTGGLSVTWRP